MISTSKAPQFFKLILQQDIVDRKLRIPPAFVRRYGGGLPKRVTLKVPSDDVWAVELSKSGRDFFFQKGWPEFSDHFGLSFGHCLFFRYEGNGVFHVVVFDKSATEIQYPLLQNLDLAGGSDNPSPSIPLQGFNDNHHSSILIGFQKLNIGEKTNSSLEEGRRSPYSAKSERAKLEKVLDPKANLASSSTHSEGFEVGPSRVGQPRSQTSTPQEVEAAKSNSFEVVLMPNNLARGYLTIPASFLENSVKLRNGEWVALWRGGEACSVKFVEHEGGRSGILSAGWMDFVKINNLQNGDVCLFKLIETCPGVVFQVSVYSQVD